MYTLKTKKLKCFLLKCSGVSFQFGFNLEENSRYRLHVDGIFNLLKHYKPLTHFTPKEALFEIPNLFPITKLT